MPTISEAALKKCRAAILAAPLALAACGDYVKVDAPDRWTRTDHELYAVGVEARLLLLESELAALRAITDEKAGR